jgi:3-hydroxyacyl-CoA dehydrogenase/enoyl-CoA hydratase/3-hydroxybutyryl-CoA epimerase/enoyl-CoA isomerase
MKVHKSPQGAAASRSLHGTTHGIRTVSIIGAGVMGRGIAIANVNAGIHVRISDMNDAVAKAAVDEILAACPSPTGTAGQSVQTANSPVVSMAHSDAEIADADLIIEAVVENAEIKTALLSRLEPFIRSDTLVASNSSSVSMTHLASCLLDSSRFCGLHFCHPVSDRRLVEIVGAETTSPETLATIHSYATSIGMAPIAVKDGPGFLLNRLLVLYLNEALELLLDGADLEAINTAASQFGLPTGPLAQIDEFGIDVALEVGRTLFWKYPERIAPSSLLVGMYKAGRLGRKSGNGFYFDNGHRHRTIVPSVREMIRERSHDREPPSETEISRRLFLPMFLEATRTLDESLVESTTIIDTALRDGLGLTHAYRGLFAWADSMGAARLLEWLHRFEPLGKRFEPTPYVLDVAADTTRTFADRRHAA